MGKSALTLIWAAVFIAGAAPAAQPTTPFELVGFTAATFKGDVGLFALTDACGEEFSRSRICEVREVAETVAPPVLTGGPAWMSEESRTFLECAGWTSMAVTVIAATVTVDGEFERLSCNVARPVACCSR